MKNGKRKPNTIATNSYQLKIKFKEFVDRTKKLQGDPHYVAVGMAVGVFIGITPTFPFHTAIALFLAFIFRGSKPAAVIGVWVGNPLTMPFLYLGSYEIGVLILGHSAPFDVKYESITELLNLGLDVTAALVIGGALLGIIPAVCTYFITRRIFIAIRHRKKKGQTTKQEV